MDKEKLKKGLLDLIPLYYFQLLNNPFIFFISKSSLIIQFFSKLHPKNSPIRGLLLIKQHMSSFGNLV